MKFNKRCTEILEGFKGPNTNAILNKINTSLEDYDINVDPFNIKIEDDTVALEVLQEIISHIQFIDCQVQISYKQNSSSSDISTYLKIVKDGVAISMWKISLVLLNDNDYYLVLKINLKYGEHEGGDNLNYQELLRTILKAARDR